MHIVPIHSTNIDKMKDMKVAKDRIMKKVNNSKSHPNINSQEIDTLKELTHRQDLQFLPSDKGGEFCIIDIEEYNRLGFLHLSDTNTYERITKINIQGIEKQINNTWLSVCQDKTYLTRSFINSYISHNSRIANIYFLVKTHKPGNKVRPIVSSINTPTYKISWLLSYLLKPILKEIYANADLMERIQSFEGVFHEFTFLCSLDVVSLYTSILIDDAINSLADFINIKNIKIQFFSTNKLKTFTCLNLKKIHSFPLTMFFLSKSKGFLWDPVFLQS